MVRALKNQLLKGNVKTKLYREYISFNLDITKKTLKIASKIILSKNTPIFKIFFLEILHKRAPIKRKILRFNDNPFTTKSLRKCTGQNSENVYNNTRANEDSDN